MLSSKEALGVTIRCKRSIVRILVKLATNNASKLAGDNASTCPLQKELQAES